MALAAYGRQSAQGGTEASLRLQAAARISIPVVCVGRAAAAAIKEAQTVAISFRHSEALISFPCTRAAAAVKRTHAHTHALRTYGACSRQKGRGLPLRGSGVAQRG